MLVPTPAGAQNPLSLVVEMRTVTGPPMVRSAGGKLVGFEYLRVVGRDGGYTKQVGDVVVVVPTVADSRITPHAEAFQAVVWHCLVSHPALQQMATNW